MKTDQASLLSIIDNYEGLYEGNLRAYVRALMCDSTGASNPYHNTRHGFHVLWECYDGGRYHRLPPVEFGNLLRAAPMHDFNHYGKIRGRDAEEIETALLGLRNFIPEVNKHRLPAIEAIIRATQYPYVIPDSELTLPMRIIRDADMSQNFADAWMQQSWLGLAEEMGLDPEKFLRMQPEFLASVKFHTGWAKDKFEAKRAARIAEIKTYIDILDGKDPVTFRKVA